MRVTLRWYSLWRLPDGQLRLLPGRKGEGKRVASFRVSSFRAAKRRADQLMGWR